MYCQNWVVKALLVSGATMMSGCVAVAVAPLVAGALPSEVTATVDEKSITPEIREAFANSRALAFVAGDRAAVVAADQFETKGGYVVAIDRATGKNGELTGSERREALRRLCVNAKPDIALLGRVVKTDGANAALAMVTGRNSSGNSWIMDMLVCRTNTTMSFSGRVDVNLNIATEGKSPEVEEMVGKELGSKILQAVGVARALSPDGEILAANLRTGNGSSSETAKGDAKSRTMTPQEVQRKLIELGYLKGKADGIFGKQSIESLKKFQVDSKLPPTGTADEATIARLSVASKTK